MHSPFVGAYWPARQETKAQCARRIAAFFDRIATLPELSQWFTKAKSAKAASKLPVPVTAEGIESYLKTNNRDVDGSAIAELGFNLNLWNGGSATLSITCGAFSPAIRNSVVVNLPPTAEVGEDALAMLRSLLDACIDAWEPANAVATSPQLMTQEGGGMPWQTRGWLNYSKGGAVPTQ